MIDKTELSCWLRSSDIFDIVELDFQQYLADDEPGATLQADNPAMVAWQKINEQFELLKVGCPRLHHHASKE
jgi:hypothetical protein